MRRETASAPFHLILVSLIMFMSAKVSLMHCLRAHNFLFIALYAFVEKGHVFSHSIELSQSHLFMTKGQKSTDIIKLVFTFTLSCPCPD